MPSNCRVAATEVAGATAATAPSAQMVAMSFFMGRTLAGAPRSAPQPQAKVRLNLERPPRLWRPLALGWTLGCQLQAAAASSPATAISCVPRNRSSGSTCALTRSGGRGPPRRRTPPGRPGARRSSGTAGATSTPPGPPSRAPGRRGSARPARAPSGRRRRTSRTAAGIEPSAPLPGRASAPPAWRSSTTHQRAAGARAAGVDEAVDRVGGQLVEQRVVAEAGHRVLGIHVDPAERGRRDHRERVDLRLERAQRRQHLLGEYWSPSAAPSITTTPRPRRNSGTSGFAGICMMRADVVTLSGAVAVHSRQACSTSRARSHGHSIMPA